MNYSPSCPSDRRFGEFRGWPRLHAFGDRLASLATVDGARGAGQRGGGEELAAGGASAAMASCRGWVTIDILWTICILLR